MRRLTLICTLLLGASCGGDSLEPEPPQRDKFELVSQAAWSAVEGDEDPYNEGKTPPDCGPGGYKVETTILEIETDICPYVTLKQATLGDIEPGDEIKFHFWHLTLIADPPAEAHVIVQLTEEFKFEQTIPIPNMEQIYPVTWKASQKIPKGTDIFLHLHNHGYNSYRLSKIEVIPPN